MLFHRLTETHDQIHWCQNLLLKFYWRLQIFHVIFTTRDHTIVKVLSQTNKKILQRGAYLSDDILHDAKNLGLDDGVIAAQGVNSDKEPMPTYTQP